MGEKNVAVLCTRDHSVEYNLQVDVKYGLSRDHQTTTESNNPALPGLHLQNFQIFLNKEDNFTLKRGIEDQLP